MKRCGKCHLVKPLDEFYRQTRSPDGHGYRCKQCVAEWHIEDYAKNAARAKAAASRWAKANREEVNRRHREQRATDPVAARARDRARTHRTKYGLLPDWFEKTLAEQGGGCAICGNPPTLPADQWGVLYVDHDHKTGAARGLLCNKCNNALGCFKDDPGRLRSAAEYVERHGR